LRTIVDNHQPRQSETVFDVLLILDQLMARSVPGRDKVIADMTIGGNLLRGATWVLVYIRDHGTFDDLILEAEDVDDVNPRSRRWDAWMAGGLYEFKWWYSWSARSSRTFLRQILQDYQRTRVGVDLPLRWVFGPSPLTRADIIQAMEEALDGVKDDLRAHRKPAVDGYTPRIVDFIKARLNAIVVR
jgi:hypothetical protein